MENEQNINSKEDNVNTKPAKSGKAKKIIIVLLIILIVAGGLGGICYTNYTKALDLAEQGNELLYKGEINQASELANEALQIFPNLKTAIELQGNIALYNGYIDSIDKAVVSYNTNNFEYAYKYCSEVPDNELGVLAKEGYSDVIKNILNDYKYINDEPISATAANYIIFTREKGFSEPGVDVMLYLENHLSKPVSVTVEGWVDGIPMKNISDSGQKSSWTFELEPFDWTNDYSIYFNNVYTLSADDELNFSIDVTDYKILG